MANTEEIAESWRAEVISSLPWQRASNQGDVGAGDLRGFPVVAPGFPGRGFLKPGIAIVDSQRKSYAAREKIAADLAHDLSLPVPPAVLWRRKEHWEEVESRVVVSLYLYLESIDWALVEYAGKRPLNLDEGEARVVLAATSGMLAFDTWVDQHEHGPPYPGNLVWGYNRQTRDSKIVFLDYASALGAHDSWSEEGWRIVSAPAMQPLLRANQQPALLERAVASIENVTDESISSIVQRIPDDFLSSASKAVPSDTRSPRPHAAAAKGNAMILRYHYAVLSFVTDLSDPRSEAVPVAVIAIGPINEEIGFCYFAAEKRPSIAADSDSFGLLKDLPKLLDTMIREGLAQAGPGKLLEWLQSSLRHTLALGQSRPETLSIETEPFQVQELLAGLAPLYERHVARPSQEETPVRSLPSVHIDVTEASEFGQQTR